MGGRGVGVAAAFLPCRHNSDVCEVLLWGGPHRASSSSSSPLPPPHPTRSLDRRCRLRPPPRTAPLFSSRGGDDGGGDVGGTARRFRGRASAAPDAETTTPSRHSRDLSDDGTSSAARPGAGNVDDEGDDDDDIGDDELRAARRRTERRPSASRRLASLLLAAAVLAGGAPSSLDGGVATLNYNARAATVVEYSSSSAARDGGHDSDERRVQSTTTSPSWPSPSDQLLKSMSEREEHDNDGKDNNNIIKNGSNNNNPRYWDAMGSGSPEDVRLANVRLVDSAVSTISTTYYDASGGFDFDPMEFYGGWKRLRSGAMALRPDDDARKDAAAAHAASAGAFPMLDEGGFDSREGTVATLKSIVASLNDPYSTYLTRRELEMELQDNGGSAGFLGLGALVEPPPRSSYSNWNGGGNLAAHGNRKLAGATTTATTTSSDELLERIARRPRQGGASQIFPLDRRQRGQFAIPPSSKGRGNDGELSRVARNSRKGKTMSVADAANLPVITAIIPDSPAERAGLVVGDRIASVGDFRFDTGMTKAQVERTLNEKFRGGENYFGRAELTVASRVTADSLLGFDDGGGGGGEGPAAGEEEKYVFEDGWYRPNDKSRQRRAFRNGYLADQVLGYEVSHVKSIPTALTARLEAAAASSSTTTATTTTRGADSPSGIPGVVVAGGNSIVHYELLTPDDSIFQRAAGSSDADSRDRKPVGYIRLTRFSKAATEGYLDAIRSLEGAGAQSYIIDLRNNYGGIIQEAMLTASTLIRDPHDVLCWTKNSRGGSKPQENQEYVVDPRYPGYLLSREPSTVSRDQVRREHPEYLEDGGWTSATSYASLKELRATRGIRPAHAVSNANGGARGEGLQRPVAYSDRKEIDLQKLADVMTWNSEKKLVILINEGTASSAEVFASALHDNGRTVALVGTKTFGKGLIQHTFPMPDGGGLRLTVAEYLTPSLQHVTKVGAAKNDSGVKPDVRCDSKQGIPQDVGADLCVGVALDVLESEGA